MSEATQQVMLRGSWREALKVVAWLAVAEIGAVASSGLAIGVIIALIAFIAFVPALEAELRGILMVAAGVLVTLMFAPLTPEHCFMLATAIYVALAVAVLAAPVCGGAGLTLDGAGATVTQFWATRRFAWSKTAPELLADLAGKPVAVALAPVDPARKPYYLPDRYGLSPADLYARMKEVRAA